MVKGSVLRGVAVVEDKDEILMDPWLELKLVFLLIDSELELNDFDSAELNVFWHKKQGTIIVGNKRWCFLTQKTGTGCWSKWQHETFLIHYFAL
jgi:hypothetical protein